MTEESKGTYSDLTARLESQLRLRRFFHKLFAEVYQLKGSEICIEVIEQEMLVHLLDRGEEVKTIRVKKDWYPQVRQWLMERWAPQLEDNPLERYSIKKRESFPVQVKVGDGYYQAVYKNLAKSISLCDIKKISISEGINLLCSDSPLLFSQFKDISLRSTGLIILTSPNNSVLAKSIATMLGLFGGYYGGDFKDPTVKTVATHLAKRELIIVSLVESSIAKILGKFSNYINLNVIDSVAGIVGLNFVGRICENCAKEKSLPNSLLKYLPDSFKPESARYRESSGCELCKQSAFSGWVVLPQAVAMSTSLQNLIDEKPAATLYEEYLATCDFNDYVDLGVLAAFKGKTSASALRMANLIEGSSSSSDDVRPLVVEDDYFVMEMPAENSSDEQNAALLTSIDQDVVQELGTNGDDRKFEVLVVEDDPDQRDILKIVLEEVGYQVNIAENGQKAMDFFNTIKPDLVIADIMMPQMNGEELVAAMKSNPELKSIPILVLTVLKDADREYKLLDMGVDEYCEKTIQRKVLLKRIDNLLKRFYGTGLAS